MNFVSSAEISELAGLLGYSDAEVAEEMAGLLRARVSFLVRAAGFTTERQVGRYLAELLKRHPTDQELALSRRAKRRIRLTEAEKIELEKAQCDRCKLCGKFLDSLARPHVDHIVPLAQGGEDSFSNLQLLCSECNLGKKDLSSWLLGIPYQSEERSSRLRYVVLSRAGGRCAVADCDALSENSELELMSRVPLARGGRWVFDNLTVMCIDHARKVNSERMQTTRSALSHHRKGSNRKLIS